MAHVHTETCYHGGRYRRPLAERFWPRVAKGPGCWTWQGARNGDGYGSIVRGAPEGGTMLAHRASWLLAHGAEPSGHLMHTCDNPGCVNPDHLRLGSPADNAHDRTAKGRGGDHRGEANGRAKLTERDVELIRRLYAGGGVDQARLAAVFGVSPSLISQVITRKVWAD